MTETNQPVTLKSITDYFNDAYSSTKYEPDSLRAMERGLRSSVLDYTLQIIYEKNQTIKQNMIGTLENLYGIERDK